MSQGITVYFIADLLPLIILSVFFSLLPFITLPQIQFGVRIGSDLGCSNIIKALKYEYSLIEIVGISSIVIFLTYILGPSIFVELFGILLFLPFSFSLYGIFRVRVGKIKKTSEITKENDVATAVILQEPVRVQKWLAIIPWLVISVPFMADLADISQFRSIFSYPAFFQPLWVIIFLTITMEGIAFLILGVSPFQNSESPVKNALQMSKFNKLNFYLLILLSSVININIILSNYFLSGINMGAYIYADLLLPSFLLLVILGIGTRYGQVGWKLFPQARESMQSKGSRDDDKLWMFGVFYYNRNDSSILVPKRFGFGYTLNFGNLISLLIIFSILFGTGFLLLFISRI
jgi:uncharacterized membrane protein